MKAEGALAKSPVRESFIIPGNARRLLVAFAAAAGMGAAGYTAQIQGLYFLQVVLRVDKMTSFVVVGTALLVAMPFFILFGALSDRVGRKPIITAGLALFTLACFLTYWAITRVANPDLAEFQHGTAVTVRASSCNFLLFVTPNTRPSECDQVKDFLTKAGVSYKSAPAPTGATPVTRIGGAEVVGFDTAALGTALSRAGLPVAADPARTRKAAVVFLLLGLLSSYAMAFGPMAAWLAELFPARVRYTSISLPYHLGAGLLGGMVPLFVSALSIWAGDVYFGLWYPVGITAAALAVVLLVRTEPPPPEDFLP